MKQKLFTERAEDGLSSPMDLSSICVCRTAGRMDSQPCSPNMPLIWGKIRNKCGKDVAAHFRDTGLQLECLLWEPWEEGLTLGIPTSQQLPRAHCSKSGYFPGVSGHSTRHTMVGHENFGLKSQHLSSLF